jgi:glycosyltransferase involved in cell wall biosynthesis
MDTTLSIIVPCYNEKATILELLNKVNQVDLGRVKKEIIIIDDFSIDGTRDVLKEQSQYKIIFNSKNYGKGYSIRKGLKIASGNIIIIQDADLEYNPANYNDLIYPIINSNIDVVFGSRSLGPNNKHHSHFTFFLGGKLLTKLTNLLYFSKLTDQPTCYKVFKKNIIDKVLLSENGFGFCSEVTCKLLVNNIYPYEVPIDYFPRNKLEGKKISWKDGLRAIYIIVKYRIISIIKPLSIRFPEF